MADSPLWRELVVKSAIYAEAEVADYWVVVVPVGRLFAYVRGVAE